MSQIQITQYAGKLNMANANLIWEVTSSQYDKPQFQYICALKDGCGNLLTTIKQQPNPSGFGVFDLGRIVKQYLSYDAYPSLFSGGVDGYFQQNKNTAEFFQVAFGEQYAANLTESVKYYSGIGNATGSAAFTGSAPYYYFINGVLDPNYGSWDWDFSNNYKLLSTPSSATFNHNVCLTDAPRTQTARSTDYMTISALNGNLLPNSSTAQDLYAMVVDVYDSSNTNIFQDTIYNISNNAGGVVNYNFGGPRTSEAQLWSAVNGINTCTGSVNNTQTAGTSLIHMPIGPQNISNLSNIDLSTTNWDYYTIKIHPQQSANTLNPNGVWDTFRIEKSTGNCEYNGVRFAFINNYGVFDWFTFTLADSNEYNINRGIYKQNFVDYSTPTTTVNYDISRRGNNGYFTNINQTFTANSDWLTQEKADWLEQLLYSPNVYIQDGINMIPVIITTTTFQTKTNPRSQKNFNYTIQYTLANGKRSR